MRMSFGLVQRKTALLYVSSLSGNRARFIRCNGEVRRTAAVRKDGLHTFTLDTKLTKGMLSVTLLDSEKQPILTLTSEHRSETATVCKDKRYFLLFTFAHASGSYELTVTEA